MTQYRGYCLSDKELVEMVGTTVNRRGGRTMAQGRCAKCDEPVNRIIVKGN